jgi:ATP synthase protein I
VPSNFLTVWLHEPYGPPAFAKILLDHARRQRQVGRTKMSDPESDHDRLEGIEERIREAKGRVPVRKEKAQPSKFGIAFRLSTELVAAVFVGGLIGWALDTWLGTAPFLLIVMFFLGVATGFRNVVRAARKLSESAGPESG